MAEMSVAPPIAQVVVYFAVSDEAISRERAKLDFLLGRRAVYTGNRVEALQYLSRARRVIKRRKLGVTVAALKLAPRLLFRYVRYRYPTEHAFVSGVE